MQRFPQLPQMGGRGCTVDQQIVSTQQQQTNQTRLQVCAMQVRVTEACLQCAYELSLQP